jgi:hypothetical protein
MMPAGKDIDSLLVELRSTLDEEIALLTHRAEQLEVLSQAVAERDDEVMDGLLREMERTIGVQTRADLKLNNLRNSIAAELGWPPQEMKLARLIPMLSDPMRLELDYRRRQIVTLSDRVRQRHMQASIMVMECSRINRALLDTLFPRQSVQTYDAGGRQEWTNGAGLVDAEL